MMDTIDMALIDLLMTTGRLSWAELGERLGLSAPATAERVRRLEERGVILGYAALVDPESLGLGLTAFVTVSLDRPEHRVPFLERVAALAEVQECHHVAGDGDYLLKVRCRGTRHLEQLISDDLKGLAGIARTRTTIALSTVKETSVLGPLPTDTAPPPTARGRHPRTPRPAAGADHEPPERR